MLEFIEWHVEAAFKQEASSVVSMVAMQRKGKKDIGQLLKVAMKGYFAEQDTFKTSQQRTKYTSALETLWSELWPIPFFVEMHGLEHLYQVDLVGFKLQMPEAWQYPSALAYLQLGLADIMHVLAAKHLGCDFFGTLDSDYLRSAEVIKEATGITVICGADNLLSLMQPLMQRS
jgi:hypothetical protein